MSKAAGLAPVQPAATVGQTSIAAWATIMLVAACYSAVVVSAYLALTWPRVATARPALAIALFGFGGALVAMFGRRSTRALAARWAVPLIAFAIGWLYLGAVVTWSHPPIEIELLFLVSAATTQLICVGVSFVFALFKDRAVGISGVMVVVLTWVCVVAGPGQHAVRGLRLRHVASTLTDQASSVLDDPAQSKDLGPFVAYGDHGGRVVGWLLGSGFLGRGPGLVWDPDGVLDGSGRATTISGYPWELDGAQCDLINEHWRYCALR